MRFYDRALRIAVVLGCALVAHQFALHFGSGGLWKGLGAAHAVAATAPSDYDLTQLVAVNETLKKIRDKYVDPSRVNPQQMFLSALNQVQREVAPVIVLHEDNTPTVKVRVDTEEREFRVDTVKGPWDVSARLREVFTFLQANLKDTDVDLRNVEYAACNGMLRTLDPHSVFLSPDAYAEMNLSTSGYFGGLGIVISIRDQALTIIRPMPDTPAGQAGLKRFDRITMINNESTLNMPLDDAVKRLRGKPGSQVTIWVQRDGKEGWSGAKPFELTREEIRIRSVDHRLLKPGIGYVRIKQFQASTNDELEAALGELKKAEPIKGLILDLRSNPGGLLDQAAQVADHWLQRGVIVSTVGNSEGREEKRAKRLGTEPNYPLIVLVNGSSASASEIVSGALKNHDRAVLVGQTTFGKGSVQLVFSRIADNSALKLTIAQYLTPGGISIQGVGVTPDIELDPMTADTLEMDLFRSEERLSERDLNKSLSNGAVRRDERPWVTLRYNLPEKERAEMRELGRDVEDEFRLDFPVRFSRDLVAKLPRSRRQEQLEAVKDAIDKEQQSEVEKIAGDLRNLGIDWTAAPSPEGKGPASGDYKVKVETNRVNNRVQAGQSMELKVQVTNTSTLPIYRLRAITKSDNADYDERELVFGRIDPGQTKIAKSPLGRCERELDPEGEQSSSPPDPKEPCKVPLDSVTRQDVVKVRFTAEGGDAPTDAELRPTVESLPQPSFAYTYQIADNRPGNGDGQVSRGEGASIYLDVKNTGKGKSYQTQALLRNLTGDGLLLRAGRFDLSNLQPGETRRVVFTFDALEGLKDDTAKIEVSVVDQDLRVVSNEKIVLPIATAELPIAAATGRVAIKEQVGVRGQASESAPVVALIGAGSRLTRTGEYKGFTRVKLDDTRFGFLDSDDVSNTNDAEKIVLEPVLSHSPPLVEVKPATLATSADTVRIEGFATDVDQVRDAYAFVSSRKVFYMSNRKSNHPKKLEFSFDAQLKPGINVITVVARENEDTASAQTLVVRKDGPNGEALPTPRGDNFGADWEFSGDEEP
jgi:carboxyl-terminal processing protease